MKLVELHLSFIGWSLLAILIYTVLSVIMIVPIVVTESAAAIVIGAVGLIIATIAYAIVCALVLSPYMTAADTAFYREIKDQKYSNPYVEGEAVVEDFADPEPQPESQEFISE